MLETADPARTERRRRGMNERTHVKSDNFGRTARRARYMVSADDRNQLPLPGELGQLLARVAESHDRQAFATLFRYYAPRLKSFLAKQGFVDGEAEDLIQETMLNLWRKAESFDASKAGVSTWIFTIARNCGIDRRRRMARMSSEPVADDFDAVDPDPSAEQQIVVRENEAAVRAALERLPAEQAAVIRMSFYGENPQAEIAKTLGIPLGTVKSRVRLALQKLRQIMEEL